MILRAGEWIIVRDGPEKQAKKICYNEDHPLGQIAGGEDTCVQSLVETRGKTLDVNAICLIPGARVIIRGIIRTLGPDTYHTDSHIHFDRADNAGTADVSLGLTAKRMGPCKPGDTPG